MTLEHVTTSDGNVFGDLGFPPDEADNLKIRSRLMAEIRRRIEREGLTQVDAGKRFGVSQPRISSLVRGRIEEFTIDSLVNMLSHAGIKIEIVVAADG